VTVAEVVAEPRHPTPLWSKNDRAVAGLSLALGGGLWAWGWWAASGTADVEETIFGVVLGVAAIGVAASGGLSWITTGRSAVRARQREVASVIDQRVAALPVCSAASNDAEAVVAVAGSPRFHRPDCLLVVGKDVTTLLSSAELLPPRIACEMCRP